MNGRSGTQLANLTGLGPTGFDSPFHTHSPFGQVPGTPLFPICAPVLSSTQYMLVASLHSQHGTRIVVLVFRVSYILKLHPYYMYIMCT